MPSRRETPGAPILEAGIPEPRAGAGPGTGGGVRGARPRAAAVLAGVLVLALSSTGVGQDGGEGGPRACEEATEPAPEGPSGTARRGDGSTGGSAARRDGAPRCAVLARADSIRRSLERPPGSRPAGLGWYVSAPLRWVVGGIGWLVLAGYQASDQARVLAEEADEQFSLEPSLTSLGMRSSLAGEVEVRPLPPLFAEAAYSIRGSQRYTAGLATGDAEAELVPGSSPHRAMELWGRFESHAQPHFWGIGPEASAATRSDFGWDRIEAVAVARARGPVVGVEGVLAFEDNLVLRGGDDARPDLQDVFGDRLFGVRERVRYARAGVDLLVDGTYWRGLQPRGAAVRLGAAGYAGLGAEAHGFTRLRATGLGRLPVTHRMRLQLEGRVVGTRGEAVERIPFYHLTAIGGDRGPRGYSSRRFRDLDAAVLQTEWVYEIWRDEPAVMEGFTLFDVGSVGPRLDRLGSPKSSWGLGVRVFKRQELTLEGYVAFSEEGTRLSVSLGPSFR